MLFFHVWKEQNMLPPSAKFCDHSIRIVPCGRGTHHRKLWGCATDAMKERPKNIVAGIKCRSKNILAGIKSRPKKIETKRESIFRGEKCKIDPKNIDVD